MEKEDAIAGGVRGGGQGGSGGEPGEEGLNDVRVHPVERVLVDHGDGAGNVDGASQEMLLAGGFHRLCLKARDRHGAVRR